MAGLTADVFAAATGKADLRRSGAPPQRALPPNPRPVLLPKLVRQPNTNGGHMEDPGHLGTAWLNRGETSL